MLFLNLCIESWIDLGRYDLNDVLPTCDSCGEQIHLDSPHDIIREQYWPGSATRKSSYLFDTDLFLFYDLLKKNNPGVSETGFLKTLDQMSLAKGRVSNIVTKYSQLILHGMPSVGWFLECHHIQ